MKKLVFSVMIMGVFYTNAQELLEVLKPFNSCSSIPSNHPFHKVSRGNYRGGGTFADPITGEGSAYMWWRVASTYNFPAGYHLPTQAEWRTIAPDNEAWNMDNNNTKLNLLETHQFGKAGLSTTSYKTFKADYYKASDGTIYGIRFKPSDQNSGNFIANNNNDYTTAYRYRSLEDRVIVDINYIGSANVNISNITNASYWENASCKDAFVFLRKGYWTDQGYKYKAGEAWFWMADISDETSSGVWWTAYQGSMGGFQSNGEDYMDTIRLFKD